MGVVTTAPATMRVSLANFRRLLSAIRPYWGALARSTALALVLSLFGLAAPFLTKLLIDRVLPSGDVSLLHVLVLASLMFGLVTTILGALRNYYGVYIGGTMGAAFSLAFFNHLQHLPLSFFEQHRVGEVTSRFGDVRASLSTTSQIMSSTLMNLCYLVVVPPVLFGLEWRLAILALAVVPLNAALTFISGRMLRKRWKRSAEASAEVNAIQVEVLSQIRTFKSLGAERLVFERARAAARDSLTAQFSANRLSQGFGLASGLLSLVNTSLFTWVGWTFILERHMSLGSFIAFSGYVGFLYGPIGGLIGTYNDFQQVSISLQRMFEYLDESPEQAPETVMHPPVRGSSIRLSGPIELRNVTLEYPSGCRAIDGLSLRLDQGEVVCCCGPSGAGKTSVVRLLLRFNQPTSGSVMIGRRRLDSIPLSDLRRQIAVVMQEVSLVRGTVRDNLVLGNPAATHERIEAATRISRLDSTIAELSNGYDTPVAEWGATLSGGQRQRFAIARALLNDTPILVLDESTSNIDVQTEMAILKDVFDAYRGRLVMFVTHRIAAAKLADRVCVLEGGRLQAFGSPSDVLAESAYFRRMHEIGLRGQPSVGNPPSFGHVQQAAENSAKRIGAADRAGRGPA